MTDDADVDDARADAAEQAVGEIQRRQTLDACAARIQLRPVITVPIDSSSSRTEAIDQHALKRREKRLDDDQDRERDLQLRQR